LSNEEKKTPIMLSFADIEKLHRSEIAKINAKYPKGESSYSMRDEWTELNNKKQFVSIASLVAFLEEKKKWRILHHPEDDLINELFVLLGAKEIKKVEW